MNYEQWLRVEARYRRETMSVRPRVVRDDHWGRRHRGALARWWRARPAAVDGPAEVPQPISVATTRPASPVTTRPVSVAGCAR